jgi:hypothetical protein
MKIYEVVFDEEQDKGVYALSCVENPAMEDVWLTLADHPKEVKLSEIDAEKGIFLGAALIPNKKIYRNIDGEEFYIQFSEDTIERTAHAFIKNGFSNNSTENHETKLEGMSVVESWIVQDPIKDKSAAYGKTYEKGTWVSMMKADNEEVRQKAKDGLLNGFSIDGLFSLKELELKKSINKNELNMSEVKKTILQELREAIGLTKAEVKMGTLKLKDGKTKIEFDGDKPEIEMPVFLVLEDGEKTALPEGEHELEDGSKLFVDANGLVQAEPVAVEEPVVEEPKEEMVAELMEIIKGLDAKFSTQVEEIKKGFEAKLEVAQAKNIELEAQLEKEPAADKIVKTELQRAEPKTAKERLLNVALTALNKN